jgi:RimJ/RimL family protein N-acetyltransferase
MTAQAFPILETDRLTLRAPEATDVQAYHAFYSVSGMTVGLYRGGRGEDEVTDIHAADMAHWQHHGFGIWLLRRKSEADVLGGAGVVIEDDWNTHELTWWLMPEARGHGYATEASRAIIAYVYDTLGWPEVRIFMRDENIPSHKLAQRLGGKRISRDVFPDGITRDVYALPREGGQ